MLLADKEIAIGLFLFKPLFGTIESEIEVYHTTIDSSFCLPSMRYRAC